ncbi:MAG: hypothetical protein J0L76_19975 [Rhodobacterales bacterium]|jgi:hypothetical protein|uniref:Uncharacterized protein n=2 Tax=Paracoccaceae TaxID=31989 RepID=A0AAE4YEK9_9RHOB|nr:MULTISPECIES: hypothetical protein [Paracoccaceae]MBN8633119.1 hypothetical protein [Rhodobacterales bacterium]NBZ89903.1 hypothetical protein [Stagnihabitans tardus]GHC42716.1 hypothetical protein GCM10007291_50470 [Gemmobacter nanjingensis]
MSPARQRHLALAGAAAVVAAFVAANVHLVVTAIASQPACTALPDGPAPARHSC